MRLTTALLSLIGLSAAAPAIDLSTRHEAHDPTWTLRNFIRTCDDTQNGCGYSFTIVPSTGPSIPCLFYDFVKPSEPGPVRSARYSSPSNLQCSPDSPVFVNIGYDRPGNFWVVVPVNTATRKNAFFGYDATEMRDYNIVKPDHVSKELVIGQFKRDAAPEAEAEAMPESKAIEQRDHLGTWTVKNLVRNCPAGQCDYNFEIHRSIDGDPITCSLSVNGDNQQSFAALPCSQNSNWVISWDFNAQYGFAVMTVVSTSQNYNAWFGFNSVTAVTNFPDAGPNPVAAIA